MEFKKYKLDLEHFPKALMFPDENGNMKKYYPSGFAYKSDESIYVEYLNEKNLLVAKPIGEC